MSEQLADRNIETFLPLYEIVHRWKNRCKVTLKLPLFPGYLFVRIARRQRNDVLGVPGVLAIIGPRHEPTPLPEFEIEALRNGLHLHKCEPHPYLVIGERARIRSGPLEGLEGIVLRKKSGCRVVLTVEQIAQSVAIEIDAEQLDPLPSHPPHAHVA